MTAILKVLKTNNLYTLAYEICKNKKSMIFNEMCMPFTLCSTCSVHSREYSWLHAHIAIAMHACLHTCMHACAQL